MLIKQYKARYGMAESIDGLRHPFHQEGHGGPNDVIFEQPNSQLHFQLCNHISDIKLTSV